MPSASETLAFIAKVATAAADHPGHEDASLGLIRSALGASPNSEPTIAEMSILRSHGKIEAIKAHRARTGMGLKDSKDAIELAGISLGLLKRDGSLQLAGV